MRAGSVHFMIVCLFLLSSPWAIADTRHPGLLELDEAAWYQRGRAESPLGVASSVVCVQFQQGVPLDAGENLLMAWGGLVHSRIESVQGLVAEIPTAQLANLARIPLVRWIEPVLPPLVPTADQMRACSAIDLVQGPPWSMDGSGVTLGLIEVDLPSNTHMDLAGRVQYRTSGSVGGHPTHVAGIMAGDGSASNGTFRGVAPGAMVDAHVISGLQDYLFFTDPGTLESIYSNQLMVGGAAAFNQSMGINVGANGYPCWLLGDYGVTSAVLDELVRGSLGEPVVSVWSAGNERAYNQCEKSYGSVASPACAKNILTVGAVYSDTTNTTWFSSWGPTDDGRIKPDLVTAGSQIGGDNGITSCSQDGGYEVRSGTSMAAPVVTGIVGLMQHAWNEQTDGGVSPLPSTYRAILCHTAEDRWNAGPDYRTGWGLVNAERAVARMSERTWQERSIESSGVLVLPFEVTDSSTPLRVTIAWDDPAAQPGNNAKLVNDLDVLLQSPDGTWHRPWTLNPLDPDAPAVRDSADRANPIEQVQVDLPVAGTWNAIITAGALEDNVDQVFSLISDPPLPITILQAGTLPEYIPLDGNLDVLVQVQTIGEEVIPGTPQLQYRIDAGEYQSVPLVFEDNDWYRAELSGLPCGADISFFAQLESTISGTHAFPAGGENDPLVLQVGPSLGTVFMDSFETDQGWVASGSATNGHWVREAPSGQCLWAGAPGSDAEPDSTKCMITGVDHDLSCNNVDNGCVELRSPPLQAGGSDVVLSYSRYFKSPNENWPYDDDWLQVSFSVDEGNSWHILETATQGDDTAGQWIDMSWMMEDIEHFVPTDSLLLKFVACDTSNPTRAEAAVDAVRIEQSPCSDLEPACPEDIVGNDGFVDIKDLLRMLAGFGLDDPLCDLDDDGDVDIEDLLSIINAWGQCS